VPGQVKEVIPQKGFSARKKDDGHIEFSQVVDELHALFCVHNGRFRLAAGAGIAVDAAEVAFPGAVPDHHWTRL
jgi:hypothetical protein